MTAAKLMILSDTWAVYKHESFTPVETCNCCLTEILVTQLFHHHSTESLK